MVNDQKSLTVTYGAFFCTLEGFDAPFSAMHEVLSYLQELSEDEHASDFEPDAQAIRSIVADEIQETVQADVQDGGFILRQVSAQAETQSPADNAAVEAPETVSIADKLHRIRAASTAREATEYAEDQHASESFGNSDPVAEETAQTSTEHEAEPETVESEQAPAVDADFDPSRFSAAIDAAHPDVSAQEPEMQADDQDTSFEDPAVAQADASISDILGLNTSSAVDDADDELSRELASIMNDPAPQTPQNDTMEAKVVEAETAQLDAVDLEPADLDIANGPVSELDAALSNITEPEITEVQVSGTEFSETSQDTNEDAASEAGMQEYAADEDVNAEADLTQDIHVADQVEQAHESEAPAEEETPDEAQAAFSDTAKPVSRLLDTADREMENVENTRRRNAIQHLKAAVAATRAEKNDAQSQAPEEAEDIYREDLARVVEPSPAAQDAEDAPRSLSPLMLVSEQRVDDDAPSADVPDTDAPDVGAQEESQSVVAPEPQEAPVTLAESLAPAAPVTPAEPVAPARAAPLNRASSAPRPAAQPVSEPFKAYAARMKVDGINDFLEAATAYAHYIEGRESVSRPQIMRLADELIPEGLELEERLRAFGQLLRQGKIIKAKRGQFIIDDSTRFKPE